MVVLLEIENWVIGNGGTKRGAKKGDGVREKVWRLLSLVVLVCV
jgi:hypothetical protein